MTPDLLTPPFELGSKTQNLANHLSWLDQQTRFGPLDKSMLANWIEMHRVFLAGHGSRGCYTRGCRHWLCQEAERQYNRKRADAHNRWLRQWRSDRKKALLSVEEDAL